ncbi:hypothetical protein R3P38DRAFT_2803850 [Favolaschia claudopus]|uniref:Uncharacterized protein n=1 Tax=Favolaschia claudopus TaxID=2862362 RepID=A0AAV9ZRX1_9AGAR
MFDSQLPPQFESMGLLIWYLHVNCRFSPKFAAPHFVDLPLGENGNFSPKFAAPHFVDLPLGENGNFPNHFNLNDYGGQNVDNEFCDFKMQGKESRTNRLRKNGITYHSLILSAELFDSCFPKVQMPIPSWQPGQTSRATQGSAPWLSSQGQPLLLSSGKRYELWCIQTLCTLRVTDSGVEKIFRRRSPREDGTGGEVSGWMRKGYGEQSIAACQDCAGGNFMSKAEERKGSRIG